MSIELPLLQSLGKLPLSSSKRSPQSFLQLTHQIPNGGFGKLNQKICRNIFAGKIELKNFWGGVFVVKSFNLHTQFDQFGYLQITKASAAVYHSSDESNGRNYKGEMNELLNLSINLPDEGNQSKEFESGFAAGTDILAGNGQGGNGHGGKGDGKGKNNDGHGRGSEGNDTNRLLTVTHLEWWWWFQWQRTHKVGLSQDGMAEWGCSHTVWLADTMAQAMAEEMIKSLALALSDMTEFLSLLDWDEIISSLGCMVIMLPFLFEFFYGEFPRRMAQVVNITAGAMLALAAVVPMVIMWYVLHWSNRYNREHNDIGNDSLDEDDSL